MSVRLCDEIDSSLHRGAGLSVVEVPQFGGAKGAI
jgi:hypothetical protein